MSKVKYRDSGDGRFFAPRRGSPPPPPDGYMPSDNDPYIFVPILADCPQRVWKVIKLKCCPAPVTKMYCERDKKQVKYATCKDCPAVTAYMESVLGKEVTPDVSITINNGVPKEPVTGYMPPNDYCTGSPESTDFSDERRDS